MRILVIGLTLAASLGAGPWAEPWCAGWKGKAYQAAMRSGLRDIVDRARDEPDGPPLAGVERAIRAGHVPPVMRVEGIREGTSMLLVARHARLPGWRCTLRVSQRDLGRPDAPWARPTCSELDSFRLAAWATPAARSAS